MYHLAHPLKERHCFIQSLCNAEYTVHGGKRYTTSFDFDRPYKLPQNPILISCFALITQPFLDHRAVSSVAPGMFPSQSISPIPSGSTVVHGYLFPSVSLSLSLSLSAFPPPLPPLSLSLSRPGPLRRTGVSRPDRPYLSPQAFEQLEVNTPETAPFVLPPL